MTLELCGSFFWLSGALLELLGALLKASPRSRRLRTSIFQNSQDISAEKLTFAQKSQDISAENLISEVRKTVILQFLTKVCAEIAGFQKSADVSIDFSTFSIGITKGILTCLMILDVFPS